MAENKKQSEQRTGTCVNGSAGEFHDLCAAGCDERYGKDPAKEVRFQVKAAIEKAYDERLIDPFIRICRAVKADPDLKDTVGLLAYLLGLSDRDPLVK